MRKSKYLITELSEFNAQRLNSDSVQPSVHVDNPQLSTNAFDKHEDMIRGALSRLGAIQNSLSGSTAYRSLKSKLGLDDQDVKELNIIRIVRNDNLIYDVYINFKIDEDVYWGVIKDIMGNSELKSEVFKDFDLIQTKEWVIRLKGLIIKNVKNWLKPQFGKFKLLTDEVTCYSSITGKILKMEKGSEIEVLKSYDNKIVFKYKNEQYSLTNDNFIYFNWWFEKID